MTSKDMLHPSETLSAGGVVGRTHYFVILSYCCTVDNFLLPAWLSLFLRANASDGNHDS